MPKLTEDNVILQKCRSEKLSRLFCLIASIASIIMAVLHFFVPYIFPWEHMVIELYPPIKWALFAMNFFFSFLLLWGSLLTIIVIIKWDVTYCLRNWILGGMGFFWGIGALYELIFPFPMPEVRWILPGVAIILASLYGLAILYHKK